MTDQAILLETQNPLDVKPKELEDLAAALRIAMPDSSVRIIGEVPRLDGVTFWEVINAWLPPELAHDAVAATAGIVLKEAISWARRRFKKSPGRPKYIGIYSPDGELLKSVRLNSAQGRIINETKWDREHGGDRRRPGPDEDGYP